MAHKEGLGLFAQRFRIIIGHDHARIDVKHQ
jgi:hypothetical protein